MLTDVWEPTQDLVSEHNSLGGFCDPEWFLTLSVSTQISSKSPTLPINTHGLPNSPFNQPKLDPSYILGF